MLRVSSEELAYGKPVGGIFSKSILSVKDESQVGSKKGKSHSSFSYNFIINIVLTVNTMGMYLYQTIH